MGRSERETGCGSLSVSLASHPGVGATGCEARERGCGAERDRHGVRQGEGLINFLPAAAPRPSLPHIHKPAG